jgi:glycosyltransferase involved in cell wall biosynthesis
MLQSMITSLERLESGKIMSTRPKAPVSVVIPCLNCEGTIDRALNSVSQQTWQPKEVILIDDGSTDQTLSKLQERRAGLGPSWTKILEMGENKGPGAARNAGWDVATQPYVAFLDADDAWHPLKVEIQLEYMQDHPEVAITGHRSIWLQKGENPPPLQDRYTIKPVTKRMMLVSNYWSTPTVMLKRDLDFRFEPTKRYSEDYLLWLQIIFSEYEATCIDLDLAYLYKAPYGSKGLSSQLWAMERGELDTYRRLHNDHQISSPIIVALGVFSLAKYMRRVIISKLRVMK